MSRTGWFPVTAIAILATTVIAVLASIGQGRESSAEAFLQQALLSQEENDVSSSVLSTATGKVTMLNGDVHRHHSEAVRSHTGDLLWRQWYEGCTYPHARDTRLCSIETVIHDNVRFEKMDTSDGPGEWQVMDECGYQCRATFDSGDFGIVVESTFVVGDVVELERKTIDGVAYRRFQATRRPLERALRLTESGELEPPEGLSQQDYIDSLLKASANQRFTDVYWIREDDGEIRRVERQWVSTHTDAPESAYAILPQRSTDVTEHYRHGVPVEIRPPS